MDEGGDPIPGATVTVDETAYEADDQGEVDLRRLEHPVLAVVSAPGALSEPALLGRWDASKVVTVRLLSDKESRFVLHFGGDVMLGRRYGEPPEGEPLLPSGDAESARWLVSELSPAFELADVISVNLETVVGTLPDEEAYPAKRWLLQTRPEHLSALDALGVDLVGLANNHQRDWLDAGVASTLDALEQEGLPGVGGGLGQDEAEAPLVVSAGGHKVGMLAWTSVDGGYVNDQYPQDHDELPELLLQEETWKWEARAWGEPDLGVPDGEYRIGTAWALLSDAMPALDLAGQAALWQSAEATYPELQDWVARYGHGGAAVWDDEASPAAVALLAEEVDLVVVQLHMGFQFSEAAGGAVRKAARAAVDAGADLVICHHPHVLQGVEWYNGSLIAYSLGNLVFDQNFLSTFASGFLRVVWDADLGLVDARFVPGWLHEYRPLPVADGLGRRVLRTLWERSLMEGYAERGSDLVVRTVSEAPAVGVEPVGMRFEWGTAALTVGLPEVERVRVDVPSEGVAALPAAGLVRGRLNDDPEPGLEIGVSLAGLGRFEDDDTDEVLDDPAGWTWSSEDVSVVTRRPASEARALQLVRGPDNLSPVLARTVARVPFTLHRMWEDPEGVTPLDGPLRMSVRLRAWLDGEQGLAAVRVVFYNFDDLDPTEDPLSTVLYEVTKELPELEAGWSEVLLDLPDEALEAVGGLEPNAAMLYVELSPPRVHTTVLRVDDLELIGWRTVTDQPEGYGAYSWLRATDGVARRVEVDTLPW